jgi:N-acetylneuraminic acid mutarotase
VILPDIEENEQICREFGIIFQKYNTITNRWITLPPLPCESIRGASAISHRNNLYLAGGYKNICIMYRDDTSSWTKLSKRYIHQSRKRSFSRLS